LRFHWFKYCGLMIGRDGCTPAHWAGCLDAMSPGRIFIHEHHASIVDRRLIVSRSCQTFPPMLHCTSQPEAGFLHVVSGAMQSVLGEGHARASWRLAPLDMACINHHLAPAVAWRQCTSKQYPM
jgi:hypothetical protein